MYPKRLHKSWMSQDPSGQDSINLGFGRYQQQERNRTWDGHKPRVQILTPREPLPQKRRKICPGCNAALTWLEEPRNKHFICYSCGILYNEHFENLPSSNDQNVKPLQSVDPYQQIQPAFISAARRDTMLQGEFPDNGPIESITGNARVKKVKLKPNVSPAAYDMKDDWKYEL